MADEEIILRIEADTEEAEKNIDSLTESIEQNRSETQNLQADQKKLEQQGKKNGEQWNKNAKEIALNRSSLQTMSRERKNAINITQNETRTLSQLRATLNTLKQQRNDNIVVGSKEFAATTTRIASLNKEIKAAEQAGGDFQRSVGNYSTALDGAAESMEAVIPGFGGMVRGMQAMTKSALAFIATPLGATLAAIAVALKTVQLFFTRTTDGSEKLRLATATLTAVWEAFLDVMSAVGRLIVDEVVAGFEQAGLKFAIMSATLKKGLLELELGFAKLLKRTEEVNRLQIEIAKTTIKLAVAQGDLFVSVTKSNKAFAENKEIIKEAADAAGEKVRRTRELEQAEIDLEKVIVKSTVTNAELNRQISEGIFIANDQTKSFEERRAGLTSAGEAEQALADSRVMIANEEARISRERNTINDSLIKNFQEVADLEAKAIEAETASFRLKKKLLAQEKTLLAEETAAINKADKEKEAINAKETKRINKKSELQNQILQIKKQQEIDAAKTIEERVTKELELEDLKNAKLLLNKDLTNEQLQIIQLNHEIAIAAITQKGADQVAAITAKEVSKATALDIKAKADKLARDKASQQGFISLTAQIFNEASDLARDNVVASKLFAGAAATINTLQAITKTLAVGGAFAIPSALAVGALGFAQVAKIASTSVDAPTTSPGGTGLTGIARPINVDTGGADRQISDRQVLESALEGISAQISITELNRVQNKVSVAERDSKLV